jgi:hypothetical protein
VGLAAAGTGLQVAGAMQNIAAQERDEMNRISQEFDIAIDQIEFQEWMGDSIRQVSANKRLIQDINQMQRQAAGGGRQRQEFFRNPRTGSLL